MSWPVRVSGPRIKITGANTVGAVKTATVFPSWIAYSNMQWYREAGVINSDGSITWAAAQMILGADQSTYTLTNADVPTVPGTAIRVFVVADGPSVTSEYSTIRAT